MYLNMLLKSQPENKEALKLLAECEEMEKEFEFEPSFSYSSFMKQKEDEELQKVLEL